MRRRDFITLIGGLAVGWPVAAHAQQPESIRRVGLFIGAPESDELTQARLSALRLELDQAGWSEGRNLRIDTRFAEAPHQFQAFARELVDLKPDVIFAHTTPVAAALQHQTHSIPIVFVNVSDPIGSGLVTSLARPGGNVTGLMLYEEGITGKWLAMLKEISPQLTRVALIANPQTTPFKYFLESATAVAPTLGLTIEPAPVASAVDIEKSIASIALEGGSGLVVPPSGTTMFHRDLVIALAARHRVP